MNLRIVAALAVLFAMLATPFVASAEDLYMPAGCGAPPVNGFLAPNYQTFTMVNSSVLVDIDVVVFHATLHDSVMEFELRAGAGTGGPVLGTDSFGVGAIGSYYSGTLDFGAVSLPNGTYTIVAVPSAPSEFGFGSDNTNWHTGGVYFNGGVALPAGVDACFGVDVDPVATIQDDVLVGFSRLEDTDPLAWTVVSALWLFPNDVANYFRADNSHESMNDSCTTINLVPGANAQCDDDGSSLAAQEASSICDGVDCFFPHRIASCTVGLTAGASNAGSCAPNGSGNLSVDVNTAGALAPGNLFIRYTTDAGAFADVTGAVILPVSAGASVTADDFNDCTDPTLDDTAADFCVDEDETITFSLDLDLDDQTGTAETITQVVIENVPNGTATIPSINGTLTAPGKTIVCGGTTCTVTGSFPITGTAGSWASSLTLMYTPPLNFATVSTANNTLDWDFTATTVQGTATAQDGTTQSVLIEVHEIVDAPTLYTADAPIIGTEGTPIQVYDPTADGSSSLFEANLNDVDGSEILILRFSNVPAAATLTNATFNGGTVWTVNNNALPVFFQYTDPQNDNNFDLTFEADSRETVSNLTSTLADQVRVEVNGVAAMPDLMVGNTMPTIDEDTSIDLAGMLPSLQISGALGGTVVPDPSESLKYFILVPPGATISGGGAALNATEGSNVWEIGAAGLAAAQFNPPLDQHGIYNTIRVQAVATEAIGVCGAGDPPVECTVAGQCPISGSCIRSEARNPMGTLAMGTGINMTITAVADTPQITQNPSSFTANEGTSPGITVAANSTDTSPDNQAQPEICTATFTWTATFAESGPNVNDPTAGDITLSAGTGDETGWDVSCGALSGLQINLPTDGSGSATFTLSVEADDQGDTASVMGTNFTVTIANTKAVCGDNVDDGGAEECDDGYANSSTMGGADACRSDCLNARCGDGIQDSGEQCDDGGGPGAYFTTGVGNDDNVRDACRTSCMNAFCGDSVLDSFEGCDDGNNNIQTDSCLNGCIAATCGDAFVWAGMEECDNGLSNSDTVPDACRTSCLNAFCTDGVIDTGEVCDDGNPDDTDGCPGSCELAVCGDGFVLAGMEQCDDGANNSDVQPDACRTTCQAAACGDGIVDTGEPCDDGNGVNEDVCVNTCEINVCGDGFTELAQGTEECDDGPNNSNSAPDACRPQCLAAFCGDGVQDSGESCDLGPANDDNDPNGCKTNCALPGCGDGVVGAGEMCDDGDDCTTLPCNSNTIPDACRETCTSARCGDGVLDTGEVCDDGPANSNSVPNACRLTCLLPGCGDGVIDGGETCDDGPNNSDTVAGACRTACQVASCGDSVTDPGEMCDDGPNNSDVASGACRTTCVIANCGDGVVDPGEACDDGPTNGTDPNGCEADCSLPPACGDGFVDAGEECDDGALNSDSEPDACRSDCTNPLCGDGVVDAGEECDAGMTPDDTCDSDCLIVDEPGDMGPGDDMGGNNVTPDAGNNAVNAGTGPDAGGEDTGGSEPDTGGGGGGTSPQSEDGCCRTIRRSEGDSGVAGWLAMIALGLISLRRRR